MTKTVLMVSCIHGRKRNEKKRERKYPYGTALNYIKMLLVRMDVEDCEFWAGLKNGECLGS